VNIDEIKFLMKQLEGVNYELGHNDGLKKEIDWTKVGYRDELNRKLDEELKKEES
jgi:hypothetical protein